MNLPIDMTTLPRMSGDGPSASLGSSDEAFGGRPAPFKQHGESAKPPAALWRSDLAGRSVSRILTGTKSDGTEGQHPDREPTEIFVEQMLADPMIRLVMLADGVSDNDIRILYRMRLPTRVHGRGRPETSVLSVQETAIPEPGPRPRTLRPGIGE